MTSAFEDHCWRDFIPSSILDIYSHYERDTFVGPAPALLAIDLYEMAYQGGAKPVEELHKTYPSTCGEYAHAAIAPTQRLFAAAHRAAIPIFYTTQETREDSASASTYATKRNNASFDPALYAIRPEFKPRPTDVIVRKQRASGFYGTALLAQLVQLGIRSVVICGESTSGCVRASAVDAYSHGFHVVLVEECCFDRSPISHMVNLFDMHHKYADVMRVADVERELSTLPVRS